MVSLSRAEPSRSLFHCDILFAPTVRCIQARPMRLFFPFPFPFFVHLPYHTHTDTRNGTERNGMARHQTAVMRLRLLRRRSSCSCALIHHLLYSLLVAWVLAVCCTPHCYNKYSTGFRLSKLRGPSAAPTDGEKR